MSLKRALIEDIEEICLEPEILKRLLSKLSIEKHGIKDIIEYKELIASFEEKYHMTEINTFLEGYGYNVAPSIKLPNPNEIIILIQPWTIF